MTSKKHSGILTYIIALTAVCLVFAIMQGIRDNYGIMLKGIMAHTDFSYAQISFVIAVGQIIYGATQPFFGILAIRKSNAFVMTLGIILMAIGLTATPFCGNIITLLVAFGLALPAGTGALSFGIVMGALAPIIGEKRASAASGIIQASAGVGDALMSPLIEHLTASKGITFSMPVFSLPILLMLPVVLWLGRSKTEEHKTAVQSEKGESLMQILSSSFRSKTYLCLLIGFSTCGFHMSIIETHLFSQYVANGISGQTASLTLTVYGIFTMLGAVATGFLGQKFRMKNVLASVYGIRVLIDLSFIFLPINAVFAFIATALLGLTGDSTVPPTTGIISKKVGVAKMAVVYGSIFIGHQIGAFLSAWIGGLLVSAGFGYSALWTVDLCLCALAASASFIIKD